jgi:hypothetical protein
VHCGEIVIVYWLSVVGDLAKSVALEFHKVMAMPEIDRAE